MRFGALGATCVGVYDRFVEHVPRASVLEFVQEVRALRPDLIVTVGGGTPMHTVKVALVCLGEGSADEAGFDAVRIRVDPDGARSTDEFFGGRVLRPCRCDEPRTRTRDLYTRRFIGGQVVILDLAPTVHTPEWLWLLTGVRAVDHAVRTICSRRSQPFTDAT